MEVLVGEILVGGSRNLMVYVTGHQYRIFLDKEPLVSERVPVSQFPLCPGPLVQWVVGESKTLVLATAGGQWSLLCTCPRCMAYSVGLLSLKANSAPHQTG